MIDLVIDLVAAASPADYASARRLFEEYAAWLQVELCFQRFNDELAHLSAMYGSPTGALILGRRADEAVACVGVRRFTDETCEMKRLFVREEVRGLGLGGRLARAAVQAGRRLGYRRMVLDTLGRMTSARRLYAGLGFEEVAAYYDNPFPDVRYMARAL